MLYIEKKFEYEFGKRKLLITFDSGMYGFISGIIEPTNFLEFLHAAWRKCKAAGMFPAMEFMIRRKRKTFIGRGSKADMKPSETFRGIYRIYLYPESIFPLEQNPGFAWAVSSTLNKLSRFKAIGALLRKTVENEIAHVKHYATGKAVRARILVLDRQREKMNKFHEHLNQLAYSGTGISWKQSGLADEFISLRMDLFFFIENFQAEGIAMYAELCVEKSSFDMYSEVKKTYRKGKRYVKSLKLRFEPTSSLTEDRKFIQEIKEGRSRSAPYRIGLHMVLAVMQHFRLDIDRIMQLSPIAFIKHYETAAMALDLKPLVSVNGGAGIFDYAETLRKIMKYYKSQGLDDVYEVYRKWKLDDGLS